ncbi:MAG: alpha-galactosidase [Lachnospiraceae bacterium]|nr:alpha-galactosidase [Lachnospiraceae bacterium]
MSFTYDQTQKLFTIETKNSSYLMQVDKYRILHHIYYGRKIKSDGYENLIFFYDRSCAGNPDEVYPDRTISLNTIPQEFTTFGVGDFRVHSIEVTNPDGSFGADFRYAGYKSFEGAAELPGLPHAYDNGGEAETLIITLKDKVTPLTVDLVFVIYAEKDMITRHVVYRNEGKGTLKLGRAFSLCLDLPYGKWDLLHFHGKHAKERQPERRPLSHAIETLESGRGTSSHQENPFFILCDHAANEDYGEAYGFMLIYSGGFKAEIEVDQFDSTRVVMGIQDDLFSWNLEEGGEFHTPEVILSYSKDGLTRLSHNYHDFIHENVIRGRYKTERKPVLINNWEGTYFDFDDQKIVEIAEEAAKLGVEMMVLDDGWFGERNSDNAGLGDWFVNEKKLKGGLKPMIDRIKALGLKFGIWIEPEMVNEDSDLYRKHPDWAFAMPGRKPTRCRNQLVLDMGREDVRAYLYECLSNMLRENPIDYIKWDMNRSLSDLYSRVLPADRQGETAHRYVLGLYDLMDKLTSEFPDVLFEGCSGGGGRFDAGIMYYSPQIWLSDDTDAIQRLQIQYGSSFGYPVSTMGAHVSASPNHQTGRHCPIHTRAVVAMSGTFGYELDPRKLSENDKAMIRSQIETFKKYYDVIQRGDYYRLTEFGKTYYEAWQYAAKDASEALLNLVVTNPEPNQTPLNIRLKGLDPDAIYELEYDAREYLKSLDDLEINEFSVDSGKKEAAPKRYSGSMLMYGGFTFGWIAGDYPALQMHFVKVG